MPRRSLSDSTCWNLVAKTQRLPAGEGAGVPGQGKGRYKNTIHMQSLETSADEIYALL